MYYDASNHKSVQFNMVLTTQSTVQYGSHYSDTLNLYHPMLPLNAMAYGPACHMLVAVSSRGSNLKLSSKG
jgi:hypothetical protein